MSSAPSIRAWASVKPGMKISCRGCLDLEALKGLKVGTQKTVRWPGYAAKVTVLREMGLFREDAIDVDGVQVVPKKVLDALLYPHVKLEEGARDITVFRVETFGKKRWPATPLPDRNGGSL